MNKIPVFLHIPKNAGTYILSQTMLMFRHYGIKMGWNYKNKWNLNLRRFLVYNQEQQIATLFIHDPDEVRKSSSCFTKHDLDEYCDIISVQDLLNYAISKNFFIFSIIIESGGFELVRTGLYQHLCTYKKRNPLYYTVLRDPYSRCNSMYNYLTSNDSSHESTHKAVTSESFEEYLKSNNLEDSWLIRKLINIPDHERINENHLNESYLILDNFKIADIKYTDAILNQVFYQCYKIDLSATTSKEEVNKNESKKNKIDFNTLDPSTANIFLNRTELDWKIYNRYCK